VFLFGVHCCPFILSCQLLVTHHVELVLPGAHYLVRMLDGRIDTQGTVKDLRTQGVLESITQDETVQIRESSPSSKIPLSDEDATLQSAQDIKKPRKLIEDEHREIGGVKWSIYKTYLKASWVVFITYTIMHTDAPADGMAHGSFLCFWL
jgi:hypothetical protein